MSDLYAAGVDPYCYPDSTVLRNRFNIRDAQLLADGFGMRPRQQPVEARGHYVPVAQHVEGDDRRNQHQ